jgi:hypothetical protein
MPHKISGHSGIVSLEKTAKVLFDISPRPEMTDKSSV